MTKRTAEKAQEIPKNTRGGMLDCAWMLLLAIGTNLSFKLCSVSLTGTLTTRMACDRKTCYHPKARSWIVCEKCEALYHILCARIPIQKA